MIFRVWSGSCTSLYIGVFHIGTPLSSCQRQKPATVPRFVTRPRPQPSKAGWCYVCGRQTRAETRGDSMTGEADAHCKFPNSPECDWCKSVTYTRGSLDACQSCRCVGCPWFLCNSVRAAVHLSWAAVPSASVFYCMGYRCSRTEAIKLKAVVQTRRHLIL